jgi:choline kinase
VPIDGISLLEHQVKAIKKYADIESIIIVGGYLIDKLKKHVKKSGIIPSKKTMVVNNKEYGETCCGYSLIKGLKHTENDVIYTNSDLIFKNYVIDELIKSKNDNCIAVKDFDGPFSFGEKAYLSNNLVLYIGRGNTCPYNVRAVGPTILSKKGVINLITTFNRDLVIEEQKAIHCLPLLGLFADTYELHSIKIGNYECLEINTNADWEFVNRTW